jgi:hypothetical protein
MYFVNELGSITLLLLLLDTVTPQRKEKWVLIHGIVNGFVVCFTVSDTWNYFACPTCIHQSENAYAVIYVLVLHIYHLVCFTCQRLDYIHHFVMCSLLGIPLYVQGHEMFAYTNFILFFTCGLPGGIDYYNMYRVYTDALSVKAEKRINVRLNMWLRSPGILFGCSVLWLNMLRGTTSFFYGLPVILALIWNAQYFAQEVCISYGRCQATSA